MKLKLLPVLNGRVYIKVCTQKNLILVTGEKERKIERELSVLLLSKYD